MESENRNTARRAGIYHAGRGSSTACAGPVRPG